MESRAGSSSPHGAVPSPAGCSSSYEADIAEHERPGSADYIAHSSSFLVNNVLERGSLKESGTVDESPPVKKKGAFAGVFVPTCENMWGVLIFLRFYYIVGQAGIWQTLCVVALSFAVALCTTASMSSIASSGGLASGGGPYHMISRALGPVVGASVGIMYWLAITMLAVLECLGAVESLAMAVPETEFPWHMQAIGSAFLAGLALTVWGGINIVTKLGLFFVIVVFYTLFSFYFGLFTAPHEEGGNEWLTGLSMANFEANWGPHYDRNNSFGTVLALFYPCFTGILSGANRSDVLKDPPKHIKHGTFAAIIFSFFMYVSFFILWGSVADYRYLQGHVHGGNEDLESEASHFDVGRTVVQNIVWNPFPKSAFIGIIIASLSQSLQCLIVAPRLLQQIARDDILTVLKPLAPLSKKGEPTRALLFTYLVAALLVLIGKLDLVAPLLAMCFLVAYAFMNCSCFALTWLKSPAWRPDWIHQKRWRAAYLFTAGMGFVLCLAIMITVNALWALVACVLALGLYFFINWKLEAREWGSAMDGIQYRLALRSLIHLEGSQQQCVNWRPQILILYRINVAEELQGIKHHEILRFSAQLRKSRGFCVVACVLESERRDELAMKRAAEEKSIIKEIMAEEGIQGFAEVVVAPTWSEGTSYIIQLTGIGGLVPNTVLLDWPDSSSEAVVAEQEKKDFVEVLQTALVAKKAVLGVKGLRDMPTEIVHGTIDIWWMIHDGGLLILLSWLLSQHRVWRSCHLRVFTVAENVSEERAKGAGEVLTQTLRQRRLIDVDVEVILLDHEIMEPYTFDWTLRVEDRHRFLRELHPNSRQLEPIPLEIDDLFDMESPQRSRAPSSAGDSPRSQRRPHHQGDEEHRAEVKVSDCRKNGCTSEAATGHKLGSRGHGHSIEAAATSAGHQSTSAIVPLAAEAATTSAATRSKSPFESIELGEKLGQIVHSRSKRAQLVVMNLPDLWGTEDDEVRNYMRYCDVLTQGLERVLFVHSSGREIFDICD